MNWGLRDVIFHIYDNFPEIIFQKYDEDDKLGIPGNIVEWINQTLDGDHPKFVSLSSLIQAMKQNNL